MASTARIPLRARDGSVRAWALVDEANFEELSGFRWYQNMGYAVRAVWDGARQRSVTIGMHRQIMGVGPGDDEDVDHRNRDRLDNRRGNLRFCTRGQQIQNHTPKGGTSQYRGVYLEGGQWVARVAVNGIRHNLGRFDDEEIAAGAARDFRLAHMPLAVD